MHTTPALTVRSIVGGEPVEGQALTTFAPVDPTTGLSLDDFVTATAADVNAAMAAAAQASDRLARTTPTERALFLREIADQLELAREQIVLRASVETGISDLRLNGELTRTTRQLLAFASFVSRGEHLNLVADSLPAGNPARELTRISLPIGAVVVFEASNFPLAFGTAGGDTAAALAAGCTVIAKAHPSHPGTSEIVARAIITAALRVGLPAGVFSLLQGADPLLSQQLVLHPTTAAVGFTGSHRVGRILMDLAASRPRPILVHAEMGSANPVFVTTAALVKRSDEIAEGLVGSIMLGSGQLCTKPGLVFVPDGRQGDDFIAAMAERFGLQKPIPLLNSAVRSNYLAASHAPGTAGAPASLRLISRTAPGEGAEPVEGELVELSWAEARLDPELLEERFGPAAVIVRLPEADFVAAAAELEGQLTFTIHGEPSDIPHLSPLVTALAHKAGRIVWNGYPTGVAVSPAMTHGGPYPASSTATTSVGLSAIARFQRPVTFQDFPPELMPNAGFGARVAVE